MWASVQYTGAFPAEAALTEGTLCIGAPLSVVSETRPSEGSFVNLIRFLEGRNVSKEVT